jgi:hypothetical protein
MQFRWHEESNNHPIRVPSLAISMTGQINIKSDTVAGGFNIAESRAIADFGVATGWIHILVKRKASRTFMKGARG